MNNRSGIQWIVEAVVGGNCREFALEMVPNRKIFILEDFLEEE
jgi:hypothetical protein